jgi:hypothetical protein
VFTQHKDLRIYFFHFSNDSWWVCITGGKEQNGGGGGAHFKEQNALLQAFCSSKHPPLAQENFS